MANKIVLHTPIKSEDLVDLKIGDIVYLTGKITTCRDVAHRRLIEEKRALPVNLKAALFSTQAPSFAPSLAAKTNTKWYPLDLPLPCVWKSSKKPSLNKLA